MRRSSAGRRHTRPVAIDIPPSGPPGGGADDLTTWTNTATLETKVLPGTSITHYPLAVDVTNSIQAAARNDTGGLRFVRGDGVRMGHYRSPGNRIILVGTFLGGKNLIRYYWGKSGATQPGVGFPTHEQMMTGYRLALIFEGGNPIDFSNSPAVFSKVGTPTFQTGLNGQAMKCAEGSYIETTSLKLRSEARNNRSLFALTQLPTTASQGRTIVWSNWITDQRSMQLWASSRLELSISDVPTAFTPWRFDGVNRTGWNAFGASWQAGVKEVLMLLNDDSQVILPAFDVPAPGPLHNSTEPYIIGGTKVAGAYHDGLIECVFELAGPFNSTQHLLVWKDAWLKNDEFWGKADRTPNSIDVPDVSGTPLNSEVSFASKEVTGISPDTPISVSGDGNPTYSIGTSSTLHSNIKEKGNTPGLVKNGDWIRAYHTSAPEHSTLTESFITVGTVTSPRRSTTISSTPPPTGGGTIPPPTGPADVTVTSRSALQSAFATIAGGKILQIAAGDYKSQGKLELHNRDFRGGAPLVIQSSTIPYRGPLPSEGGLLVSGESFFRSGSGGSEFGAISLKNVHNVIIRGLRVYTGNVGTAGAKWYCVDCVSCSNITFENVKFCGYKPDYIDPVTEVNYANPDTWTPVYKADDPWKKQTRGIQMGVSGSCSNITFKKCLFHYLGDFALYNASSPGTLVEDCMFSDQNSDHMRTDGAQTGFTCRRSYFGRTWATQGSPGGGVSHCDVCQNTTKTQAGWQNHTFDSCIMGPSDNNYPHIQCIFYEHDNADTYPHGKGVFVTNCLIESRVANTIYSRPGNQVIVTLSTILQNQFGGRPAYKRDLTWHSPRIQVSVTSQFGKSYGNNKIDRCVYFSHDFGGTDQVVGSTQLLAASYPTALHDYPVYSSSIWRPVIWYNPDTCVLNTNEIRRWSPKPTASIHPNQKGAHHGASQLLQSLGALVT